MTPGAASFSACWRRVLLAGRHGRGGHHSCGSSIEVQLAIGGLDSWQKTRTRNPSVQEDSLASDIYFPPPSMKSEVVLAHHTLNATSHFRQICTNMCVCTHTNTHMGANDFL